MNEEVGIPSESEEEEEEGNVELWTHVFHADRDPAPYAQSQIDEEPDMEDVRSESNHETQAKVRKFSVTLFRKVYEN